MEETSPDLQAVTRPDEASDEQEADRLSPDDGGGAPADEEDIGTEGAGTEKPTGVD